MEESSAGAGTGDQRFRGFAITVFGDGGQYIERRTVALGPERSWQEVLQELRKSYARRREGEHFGVNFARPSDLPEYERSPLEHPEVPFHEIRRKPLNDSELEAQVIDALKPK